MLMRNAGPVMNNLLGGWQVTAFNQYHSGPALTPNFTPSGFQELSNSGGVQYRPFFAKGCDAADGEARGCTFRDILKKRSATASMPAQPRPLQRMHGGLRDDQSESGSESCQSGCGLVSTPAPIRAAMFPTGFCAEILSMNWMRESIRCSTCPGRTRVWSFAAQFYNVLNKTNFTAAGHDLLLDLVRANHEYLWSWPNWPGSGAA